MGSARRSVASNSLKWRLFGLEGTSEEATAWDMSLLAKLLRGLKVFTQPS